ncbi:DsrE family protein [Bradyrhizobium manausense]|uniref:DsrE family protein n=1 Tax=Bradyrhizobium manausense TaxID=989370 RepID=UPI001BAA84D6|nr:DsrE family protein [Bradyrhizobium manausense]MBR0832316.1 DsrE family protein [Bradyrhizobium manausense]
MNRTVIVFASVAFTGAFLVNAIQTSHASQASSAKLNANAKMVVSPKRVQSHRLVVQVDVNDPAIMNLALNNVSNTVQHYSEIGQKVEVELVAFGPGLHMLRDDTSPVKARIKSMSETMPEVAFSACGNTKENMARVEAKEIPLISQAKVTKSGVVRLMELQEQGWSYLRP